MIAQVRVIRAWEYLVINYWFGGIPLITEPTETAEAAQVERSSEEAVRDFIYKELDEAIPDLPDAPAQKGRIAKGTALAIKIARIFIMMIGKQPVRLLMIFVR